MTFLTPLFLFGLLAAAIPVAIHLIRREKPPKIIFSTLRFIKTTTRKLVLFQQVQQWLLLLLRAAVICLLVFAFARPLFNQAVARMLDTDPLSAVILLDVSMSMQYGDTFERGKAAVIDILDDLAPGDEAALISFASAPVGVTELTADLTQLRSQLEAISSPGYDTVNFFPALRLANEMLTASRFETRRIYLVSDFQASGMDGATPGWNLAPGITFNGIDVSEQQTRNLMIADVRSPAQLIEGESQYDILARVRSTGSVHVSSAEVSLLIDGQLVTQVPVELSNRSETVVTLPANFTDSGARTGEVVVSGDEFVADNSWYFTIDVLPRIRTLIINGEPSPNWFDDESHWLALALEGMGGSPFVVETVEAPRFSSADLNESDVVVLLNADEMDAGTVRDLEEYVRGGGKLLFAPGDQVEAERFNRQFGAIAPGQLENPLDLENSLNEYLLIADVDRRHPALRPLELDWSARFESIWSVTANEEADVLMRFDNTMPALLERRVGQGTTMLFASSLDLEWSNLPLQSLFVPFMHETLQYLVQPVLKQRAYLVGEMIDVSQEVEGTNRLVLQDASGMEHVVPADNPAYQAQRPGLLRTGTENASWYAVNIDPEATEFSHVAPTALHDSIINPDTSPQQSREVRTAQLMAELEQPQRLWWWILGLVLLMLLVESYIANRTYR